MHQILQGSRLSNAKEYVEPPPAFDAEKVQAGGSTYSFAFESLEPRLIGWSMSLISLTGLRRSLSRCPQKGMLNCPINFVVNQIPYNSAVSFIFAKDVSSRASNLQFCGVETQSTEKQKWNRLPSKNLFLVHILFRLIPSFSALQNS